MSASRFPSANANSAPSKNKSAVRSTKIKSSSEFCGTKYAAVSIVSLMSLVVSGCMGFDTEYGASTGASGQQSVNGFGAFRTLLEQAPDEIPAPDASEAASPREMKTRDLVRLSVREEQNDAIVWVPNEWAPINETSVRKWMERWLAQGNHTLVFIVPDGGSTEEYFHVAAEVATPKQRLEYRRRLAREINERLLTDAGRENIRVKDWFAADALPYRVRLSDRRVCDFDLEPYVEPRSRSAAASGNELSELDWGKGSDDDNDGEQSDAAGDTAVEPETRRFDPLLQETVSVPGGKSSLTTLLRIMDERWGNSRILVVASGGLLTNFAMTSDAAQEIAKTIRDEIRSAASKTDEESSDSALRVSFLASDQFPIPISTVKPGIPKSKGWELMTEMPLSLINMHVAFLGVVLCLMLLPVFGRPRRVRYNRVTHFGNHLSAMATLMRRGGGKEYAQERISQYLRHVRGETSGPWVLPEPVPSPSVASPPNEGAANSGPPDAESPQTVPSAAGDAVVSDAVVASEPTGAMKRDTTVRNSAATETADDPGTPTTDAESSVKES
ncbi:hypothetical protein [Rhodopirellula sp. SWK7]|uniref:hypothetical protein n=1 Tax=Rhodopirellula sp. SWK7 TaxID=595460 RepID=UPI0002BD3F3F|nr:hypothetical protein [Rhodopirellula sp. SWK7]EMI46552.1 hypothetical protein RRSWK_00882 [Rhodopirellula sp. SWK7]